MLKRSYVEKTTFLSTSAPLSTFLLVQSYQNDVLAMKKSLKICLEKVEVVFGLFHFFEPNFTIFENKKFKNEFSTFFSRCLCSFMRYLSHFQGFEPEYNSKT